MDCDAVRGGHGVGLWFWAVAESLMHYHFATDFMDPPVVAQQTLLATNFHWRIHAWAIYGATALVIAYFAFRRRTPMLVGAPVENLFPDETWARIVGWASDIMAIAIGVAGSIAMGVFQVADGIDVLMGAAKLHLGSLPPFLPSWSRPTCPHYW